MQESQLRTMKEVADLLEQPAHRIIHVCETQVVRPTVDANGRGKARRFSREDIFRIRLALELQDAGVQLPLIKPLMRALDMFLEIPEVQELWPRLPTFDLVSVINKVSTSLRPMRAYLTPPGHVTLLVPDFHVTSHHGLPLKLLKAEDQFSWPTVTIVVNLSVLTALL